MGAAFVFFIIVAIIGGLSTAIYFLFIHQIPINLDSYIGNYVLEENNRTYDINKSGEKYFIQITDPSVNTVNIMEIDSYGLILTDLDGLKGGSVKIEVPKDNYIKLIFVKKNKRSELSLKKNMSVDVNYDSHLGYYLAENNLYHIDKLKKSYVLTVSKNTATTKTEINFKGVVLSDIDNLKDSILSIKSMDNDIINLIFKKNDKTKELVLKKINDKKFDSYVGYYELKDTLHVLLKKIGDLYYFLIIDETQGSHINKVEMNKFGIVLNTTDENDDLFKPVTHVILDAIGIKNNTIVTITTTPKADEYNLVITNFDKTNTTILKKVDYKKQTCSDITCPLSMKKITNPTDQTCNSDFGCLCPNLCSSCCSCGVGQGLINGACKDCPTNTYSLEGSTICSPCPSSTTTNNLTGQGSCV